MSKERLYFGSSRIASRKPGFSTYSGSGWFWMRRRTPRTDSSFGDPRHLRLDRLAALQRQAGDGAEHAAVAFGEAVNPIRLVEILRHVDVDFDEHQALDRIGFGGRRQIVRRPVALQRRRAARPGVAEALLVEQMDMGVDDGKIDHRRRLRACLNAAPLRRHAAVAPPRGAVDRKLFQAAADRSSIAASAALTRSRLASVSASRARGTTTTPSRSPTITSPEAIAAPPHTIGRPTVRARACRGNSG